MRRPTGWLAPPPAVVVAALALSLVLSTGAGSASDPAQGKAYPAPFDAGCAYSRELLVSPRGDDAGDGSRAKPFRTLARAARDARPGTRITLAEGTHAGGAFISRLRGERTRPIAIAGEGEAVIEGGGEAIHLSEPRFVVIEDLSVRGSRSNGINIDDGGEYDTPAEHVVLRSIRVTDVGSGGNQDGLKLSGLDRFWVVGCTIGGNSAGGSGIDMVGCHEGVLAANRIHRQGASGIQAKGGSAEILIFGNTFEDIVERAVNIGGSTGEPYFRPRGARYEARRVRVVANLFLRCGAPVAFVGCQACEVVHNTIVRPGRWPARILQETRFVEPCAGGAFANNIVVFGRGVSGEFINIGPGTRPETFTFSHNLWFDIDEPARSSPRFPKAIADRDSVAGKDPAFIDPAAGDYRIRAASPARGAAMPWKGIAHDRLGRPYARPPAAGAHEAEAR
ncbi:MAG: right-handed parallel beta-helix repeat-containing protein [Planctomycetes bacterium]|nr:right-handed parallel beta-helix repeat-containing protein [Planctomycetota bacterium]